MTQPAQPAPPPAAQPAGKGLHHCTQPKATHRTSAEGQLHGNKSPSSRRTGVPRYDNRKLA
eukprot:1690943-Amphidinium_carterae.1